MLYRLILNCFVCCFVFTLTSSLIFSQQTVSTKVFDCQNEIGFCLGMDTSKIGSPIVQVKGKKNIFEVQHKRLFLGIPVRETTIKTDGSKISLLQMTIPIKYESSLHDKISPICAALTEKRNNQIVSERLYSFVDGYRISTKLTKNVVEVDISLRDEYSLIQKNKLELIPFFGFEVGEPTSLMRGYDVRGPAERFSFRPNAKIAGVQLYSQFVKVDAKGVIQSMHLVTNPQSKKDSDDLIAYFRKNSVRSKKSKKETDKNTFLFANGYMIVVLEEDNSLYHFMITKSKKSSQ